MSVLVERARPVEEQEKVVQVVIAYLMMSPCWVAVAVVEWGCLALPVDLVVAEVWIILVQLQDHSYLVVQ